MSKFLNLTLDLLAYEAASATNDPADADKIKKTMTQTISAFSRSNPAVVPSGAVDQVVSLADASSNNFLVIFTDQSISVKVNGSATALSLSPSLAGTKTPVFFQKGTITSLSISNSGASPANVDVISAKI